MKNPSQPFVSVVTGTFAVPVGQVHLFPLPFYFHGFSMQGHAQLRFQVSKGPEVVIAGEIMDRYAAVAYPGQAPLQPYEMLGDRMFKFKPKVKDIAQQVIGPGLLAGFVQKLQQHLFPGSGSFHTGTPEVKITE
jgi:hypothetical protein